MAVKAILDTKGIDVAIIEPTADLAFAVKLLAARAIGALVPTSRSQVSSRSGTLSACWPSTALALEQPVAEKVITCTRGNDEQHH
jgi:hypothetical protein